MRMVRPGRWGFTLIELLVVIAVIGALMRSCFPPSAWSARRLVGPIAPAT